MHDYYLIHPAQQSTADCDSGSVKDAIIAHIAACISASIALCQAMCMCAPHALRKDGICSRSHRIAVGLEDSSPASHH